jgi:hypothetical protein
MVRGSGAGIPPSDQRLLPPCEPCRDLGRGVAGQPGSRRDPDPALLASAAAPFRDLEGLRPSQPGGSDLDARFVLGMYRGPMIR